LNPAFSPDGRKIVFASRRDGNEEIYVMNADGSNQKRLTTTRGDDNRPCFSPDGRKIAFTTNRHGNEEIYLMNADGTEQTRLTRSSRQDFSPCFSPDGSKIAFASDRVSSEEYEIYVMNADGSNPTRLTNSRGTDAKPTWATSSVCAIRARDAGSTLEGSAANPGAATFAISLSRASEQTVTVNYRTIDNTAKSGEDYIAQNGTLTFAPGETSKMVRIEFIGDGTAEPHESFFIDLKSPANAILTDSRASAHIRNDDPPLIFIDDAPPVFEGDPPSDGAPGTTSQTFAVYLNAPSSQTVTVDYVTVSNTADATDFVPAAGRLTFAPGETQKVITILVNGDRTIEQTETYFVNLRNPTRATIADSRGIAYIRNDDIAPGVTAQDGPSQ
jgi:dipeptidyl aminopeptidase/acylaminoacyl peptidase